ncbi:hypothetical protein [Listeria rustica]|uniref:Uncharacterized protein n=1 Tax=Listeria rustica TaxID=2713503 RepID=A0A7W1YFY3_9LIST|nr:hypothetical protein [Listeria rustica]MBA3926059.1 hypothetical protein [Listeria rustica]
MQPRQREEEVWKEQIKKERQFEELEQLFSKAKRAQENVLHTFQDAWQGNQSRQPIRTCRRDHDRRMAEAEKTDVRRG